MASPPGDFPFSLAEQRAIISANLNSTLLLQFLMGAYIGVFGATVSIYVSKTTAYNKLVVGAMIALFITTSIVGDSRVSLFLGSVFGSLAVPPTVIDQIAQLVGLLFADGLLVWRCFHACGRSLRSLLPIGLFVVEIVDVQGLVMADCIFDAFLNADPKFGTAKHVRISNRLAGAMYISAAVTSLMATFMICHQIYTHTSHYTRSRKRFRHVIDILVQSSGIYTAVVIMQAVLDYLNSGSLGPSMIPAIVAENYIDALATTIDGLVPTLMVARLAIASTSTDGTEVFSTGVPSDLEDQSPVSPGTQADDSDTTPREQQGFAEKLEGENNENFHDVVHEVPRTTEEL
ncbi:hypothetical protein CPC08DRAFT_769529 [Agrocybe pediades]|nr:hypothetical protein CPC08DRAFT_769529 [Agrocybe pediades]